MNNHITNHYDYLFKIILVGKECVGKSSVCSQYINNTFDQSHMSTIGVDFVIKHQDIDGKNVKLQIWDTAGQERFRSIVSSYYRGANGAIIIFDITNRKSFDEVSRWILELDKNTNISEIMLVGNKLDLEHKREVLHEEALHFAMRHNMTYIETSALNNININEIFNDIADRLIKSKLDAISKVIDRNVIPVSYKTVKRKEKKCCD